MKRVLYITYDGLTDPLGQSQILPYIIGLRKLGYSFTIISCEKPDKFMSGKENINVICEKHQLDWQPLIYHKSPPILSTIRDIYNIRKLAFKLHRTEPFNMVHCRSYISSYVGLEMKRSLAVPFLFDMRGFWPEERVDGNLWDLSNPIYRIVFNFFKSKEAAYVQHADAIVSLTNAGKRIILGWPGMEYSKKITVIPCSVDMNLFSFDQLHPGKLREIHSKIDSPLIIGYYGSLGTWYMLPEMLEQFKAIQNTHPLAKFLIVSNEDWQSSYDGLLEQKGISKSSIYFTRSSREDMPYYIGATDIALFFIKACYSKLSSSPTKHGEIMSMGKPLITNSGVGDLNEIITNSNTGYIVHSFDSESFELAANSIPHILKMESKKIRSECKEYYSLESALNKYQHIYHQLT